MGMTLSIAMSGFTYCLFITVAAVLLIAISVIVSLAICHLTARVCCWLWDKIGEEFTNDD